MDRADKANRRSLVRPQARGGAPEPVTLSAFASEVPSSPYRSRRATPAGTNALGDGLPRRAPCACPAGTSAARLTPWGRCIPAVPALRGDGVARHLDAG